MNLSAGNQPVPDPVSSAVAAPVAAAAPAPVAAAAPTPALGEDDDYLAQLAQLVREGEQDVKRGNDLFGSMGDEDMTEADGGGKKKKGN